ADHVDARHTLLVANEQTTNTLADLIPDAVLQAHRCRNVDRLGVAAAPAARLDGRQPRPASAGQTPTVAAAVAPAQQLELPLVPDRQNRRVVAEQELDLALAAAFVDTATQVILLEHLYGQRAPGQCNPPEHSPPRLVPPFLIRSAGEGHREPRWCFG